MAAFLATCTSGFFKVVSFGYLSLSVFSPYSWLADLTLGPPILITRGKIHVAFEPGFVRDWRTEKTAQARSGAGVDRLLFLPCGLRRIFHEFDAVFSNLFSSISAASFQSNRAT